MRDPRESLRGKMNFHFIFFPVNRLLYNALVCRATRQYSLEYVMERTTLVFFHVERPKVFEYVRAITF